MEKYLLESPCYNECIIYDFDSCSGGLGDNIKFFMFLLETCMRTKKRLLYKKNNTEVEKFLPLNYPEMYVDEMEMQTLTNAEIIAPVSLYGSVNFQYSIPISEVFRFSDEVKLNCKTLFPSDITNYISIHLRLGDKHLETDKRFVVCVDDAREFSEQNLKTCIENHMNENIFFCCDNHHFKMDMKNKYNRIIVTNGEIGHTGLANTTTKQVLDTVTEFFILTNSKHIFSGSFSGFSVIASKFHNIPLTNLYSVLPHFIQGSNL